MALTTTDLLLKLSTTAGTAGNQNAQADPNASLGKYISTTEITGGSLHNLFDAISDTENVASDVEYRCFFIHNNHADETAYTGRVWIVNQGSGGASVAIGLDPAGNVALGSSSAQAATIANEGTAPSGVSFSSPTTEGAALSVGDLDPAKVRGIWVRRTAANSAPMSGDSASLKLRFATA